MSDDRPGYWQEGGVVDEFTRREWMEARAAAGQLTVVEAIEHVASTPTTEMLQARAAMAQLVLERSVLNDPGLWLGLRVRLREAARGTA